MKKFAFTLICFIAVLMANAQTADPANTPDYLVVKQSSFDFGKIPQGRPTTHVFEIVNTGTTPLKLDNVQASCGCTTPEWSKEPILPGSAAKITVGYNAYAEGTFEKTITITYNQTQSKFLVIKGTVYKAPPSPAPENASVKLLKQVTQ